MDERRYKTLCTFVQHTDSTCVETINKDALNIDSKQCDNVEYILVDPSCSGTGNNSFTFQNKFHSISKEISRICYR